MSAEEMRVPPHAALDTSPLATGAGAARFRQPGLRFLRRILSARLAGTGLVILLIVIFCAIFAGVISPYNPNDQDYLAIRDAPSLDHFLGTDDLGRDILSRIIYGSRVSLEVGIIAVGIALSLGVSLGLAAGFIGGKTDMVIMRVVDTVQAFPSLILALAITAALGPGIGNAMIAIGFVSMTTFARLTRGQTLSEREREYVTAAQVIGVSPIRIMARHIWPNITAPIVVQATLAVATAIITEASLSFLGVGVVPPTPSWGSMLRVGAQYLDDSPWMVFAPGITIFITVLAFNFVGDGLREALDPRLRQRGH